MAKRSRVRDTVWTVVALILFTQACHQAIDPTEPPDDERPTLPSGFSADAWFVEDFSSYGEVSGDPTLDFRENTTGWWSDQFVGGHPELAEIVFDPVMGQVYRQHNGLRTAENCKPGGGAGRQLFLPNPEQEIWVEVYVRFSPTYKTHWWEECEYGEVETGDHKFIFWHRINSREGSTWRFKVGSNGDEFRMKPAEQAYEGSRSHGELPNSCFNDRWMRWRFHLRGASVQGRPDGHYEWRWVEMNDPSKIVEGECAGKPEWNAPFHITAATPTDQHDGFDRLELGLTFNDGPTTDQWWEYGEIAVWRGNPGWGW